MKRLFIIYVLLLQLTVQSCTQKGKENYDYTSLQVDTSKIAIFKWDSTIYTFPKFSEPLSLTNDDIKLVDSFLVDAVDTFNKTNSVEIYESFHKQFPLDSFKIDLSKYKRQYFPYKDNNGKRVFGVMCFSKLFLQWRTKVFYGERHGGVSYFFIRINLSYKKADEFSIGGYG